MSIKTHTHQSAERERARTQALFASLGDGVIATDENGIISEVNSAAVRILGYHAGELLGEWFPRIIRALDERDEEIGLLDRAVIRAMLTGKPIADKTLYMTKTGSRIPVAITVSPIMLEGRPVGAIEVFRDISHEYEVDRMKSEFISIASHQLRTPLTAIKTYSHMLANGFVGELTKTQLDFMTIIMSSIDRMNELINTLLDISRIEEGRLAIDRRQVDLAALLKEMMDELRPMASGRQMTLRLTIRPSKATTTTDALLVKEVCLNLLSNAIKYTPPGGKVGLTLSETKSDFVFTVTDNGYGIPQHEQKRVFSKFFRAENILDKDAGGTGLGLYLVKQVVESLGGSIVFTSEEGKGTRFRFTVPKI